MKQFFLLLLLATGISTAIAQMPKAINYQAVARNAQGQALVNQAIKVRLSIISSASGSPTLYSETRNVTTNALGLFNVQIGGPGAQATSGSFTNIDWVSNSVAAKSLKVELDINNTGAFTDMGSQSLATVPYSFAADQAVNALKINGNPVAESAPDPGDLLRWNGSAWISAPSAATHIISQNIINQTLVGGSLAFQFLGATKEITLKAGQTIIATFAASIGATGPINNLGINPAYQNTAGSNIIAFNATNYHTINLNARTLVVAHGALHVVTSGGNPAIGTIDAGTYRIGLGIRNLSGQALNQNDVINGTITIQ
ncbi:hypothetical protein [Paraflavitalea sp. CAU 1676]|uniref:hypothetical protein n=1 Tax=Paraflavitalea sp. CAU 1676 TaxID=3032598 RepID=UPI0023DBBCE5|nr:hypothetical protein [Paraflavitalea sp. CAU 1676]MDF2190357.1 hypothetical protein [Paraflavitalea sp. CAU 1676]